jgi:hypothetical protein
MGMEDRIEVWPPENGSLCQRPLAIKSLRLSVLAGQMEEKQTEQVKENAQSIFVELRDAPCCLQQNAAASEALMGCARRVGLDEICHGARKLLPGFGDIAGIGRSLPCQNLGKRPPCGTSFRNIRVLPVRVR